MASHENLRGVDTFHNETVVSVFIANATWLAYHLGKRAWDGNSLLIFSDSLFYLDPWGGKLLSWERHSIGLEIHLWSLTLVPYEIRSTQTIAL